jgi:hypothetical protein
MKNKVENTEEKVNSTKDSVRGISDLVDEFIKELNIVCPPITKEDINANRVMEKSVIVFKKWAVARYL